MIYFMYPWCIAVFFTFLIVKLIVLPAVRFQKGKHGSVKPWQSALNVSQRPVSISDLKKEEMREQLTAVSGELVRVSKLINLYAASLEDLPSDGLQRLFARQEKLRARLNNLERGDLGVNETKIVPPAPSTEYVKALPPARLSLVGVLARRS